MESGSSLSSMPVPAMLLERVLATQDRILSLQSELLSCAGAAALRLAASQSTVRRETTRRESTSVDGEEEEEDENVTDDDDVSMSDAPPIRPVRESASSAPVLLSPELHALLQSQHDSLEAIHARIRACTPTTLVRSFDMLYLPLFTVLVSHPKTQEKQQRAAPSAPAPMPQAPTFPVLPHQDRVWEVALGCLVALLSAGADSPAGLRVTLTRRFFGIFQLLLNFLGGDQQTSGEQNKEQPTSNGVQVRHSEETRLMAMSCVHKLMRCVESQFASAGESTPVDLQPLVSVFQLNPGFSISLGYYIHVMLRFASKDRHRMIRADAVAGLSQVMRVLQMAAINRPGAATPSAAYAPVPGIALLLSYFPGVVSSLYNLLIFDAKSSRAAGWKLRQAAFQLFDDLIRTVVRHVAGVKEIVDDIANGGGTSSHEKDDRQEDEPMSAEEQQAVAATRAMEQLYALVPKSSSDADSIMTVTSTSPMIRLSELHPVLQTVLKPVDSAWWRETRENIGSMQRRVLQSTTLTQRAELASTMLRAAAHYLLGSADESSSHPTLTARNATIYTTLLPSSSVLTWLEFVIFCHEHDDRALRDEAAAVINSIADRIGGQNNEHVRLALGEGGALVQAPPSSAALVPLLSAAFSQHLVRLPRLLATASESSQVALLKTIRGYVHLLGRQHALYSFVESDVARLLKILYAAWTIETRESKVLEREKDKTRRDDTDTHGAVAAVSQALAMPTYYSFTLTHVHSAAAHDLSLSILHSLGFFLADHFGLFIAHLHERLVAGIGEVARGNFSATNQVKETVLFINQIVLGAGDAMRADAQISVFDVMPHVELLLAEYLNPVLWHLPQVAGTVAGRALSHADLQNNHLIVSLLLRGIGDMATAIGVEFQGQLMHLLYPLFEQLGSMHTVIHQSALVTLHRVAVACGYADDGARTADDVLQRMVVENMDYLVEQMAVELRTIDLYDASATAQTLTLPMVLSALLTKISLSCTQAIIPLLDDVLQVILDKLCDLTVRHDQHELESEEQMSDGPGPNASAAVSSQMSRLAYLEILRSVVTAVHLIQQNDTTTVAPEVPSLFASAPPLPLLSAPTAIAAPSLSALEEADSMLNLDGYDDDDTPSTRVSDEPTAVAPTEAVPVADFFAPSSIRQRLQALVSERAEEADRARYEEEWLRRSRGGGATITEENDDDMADVPRDANGKTAAERWFEQNEAEREKRDKRKFNSIQGIPDPEAEDEMEADAKAHTEPPEVPLTKEQATALSIFQQCRHFLAPGSGPSALAQQYTTLCIAAEAIPVLERVPKHFFPEVAKFWPALLQCLRLVENATAASASAASGTRVRRELRGGAFDNSVVSDAPGKLESLMSVREGAEENAGERQLAELIQSLSTTTVTSTTGRAPHATFTHSTASPLFIQSLSVLSLLARTASKFLAGRFAQELWPVLQHILTFEHRWLAETRAAMRAHTGKGPAAMAEATAALQLLPAYKVQRALLQTLAGLARFPDLSSPHLLSLARHTAPYLSDAQPKEFQSIAIGVMHAIMQLDADVVWCVMWQLCPSIARDGDRDDQQDDEASDPPTFLAHPCFQQVFPNFDARFLRHQRTRRSEMMPPHDYKRGANEFDGNVRAILRTLDEADLAQPKLSLF